MRIITMGKKKNNFPDVHNFRSATFQSRLIQQYMVRYGMTKSELIRYMLNDFIRREEYSIEDTRQ